jgi:hypothetical protein
MTRRPTLPTSPTRDRQRPQAPRSEWPDRTTDSRLNLFEGDHPGDEGGWGHVSELGISRPDSDRRPRR